MLEKNSIDVINIEIDKIFSIFYHKKSLYIDFWMKNFSYSLLYTLNNLENKISLFYGLNFEEQIPHLRETVDCIECSLGTSIKGGVSFDDGDIVDFNLSIEKANEIIDTLQRKLKLNEIVNFTKVSSKKIL